MNPYTILENAQIEEEPPMKIIERVCVQVKLNRRMMIGMQVNPMNQQNQVYCTVLSMYSLKIVDCCMAL